MGAPNLTIFDHPVLENELMINLSNGVDETLQTMARINSIFERSFSDKNWKSPCEYSVYLEIQSLPARGQIRLHFSYQALLHLYQGMIGDGNPDHAEVVDCLGEVSNVSYGLAKGKLNREGYSLGMALPHSGKTVDLPQLLTERPNLVTPFKIFNETCYIQIVIL